jgi:hypothetical protein
MLRLPSPRTYCLGHHGKAPSEATSHEPCWDRHRFGCGGSKTQSSKSATFLPKVRSHKIQDRSECRKITYQNSISSATPYWVTSFGIGSHTPLTIFSLSKFRITFLLSSSEIPLGILDSFGPSLMLTQTVRVVGFMPIIQCMLFLQSFMEPYEQPMFPFLSSLQNASSLALLT